MPSLTGTFALSILVNKVGLKMILLVPSTYFNK